MIGAHDLVAACIGPEVKMLPLLVGVTQMQEAHTSEARDVLVMVGSEEIESAAYVQRVLVQMEDIDRELFDTTEVLKGADESEHIEIVGCTFPVAEADGNTRCTQGVL